jgi:hypothetical protein
MYHSYFESPKLIVYKMNYFLPVIQGQYSEKDAAKLVKTVAEALMWLHDKGVSTYAKNTYINLFFLM